MKREHRDAVVVLAALDLRRAPDHRSELRSQLLLGERVCLLRTARRGEWARVENRSDGYRGWIRTWGLKALSAGEAGAWDVRAKARLRWRYAEVRARPGAGPLVTPAFWNGRLAPGPRRGRWRRVELPDGREGWIESAALDSVRALRPLGGIVGDLLGAPYLWGGRTPLGFDCSGFTQQVLLLRGYHLPRDAHDQFLACRPLEAERLRAGDMVFFGRLSQRVGHVGIMLSGRRYVHARGVVRVNSLDPRSSFYDAELGKSIRSFGRPRRRGLGGRVSC